MSPAANADPVQALVARIRERAEPTSEQLEAVLRVLTLWLARRGLTTQDREDVCSEALGRLIKAVREGELDRERPPGAWLRVVADHLALDVLRRERIRAGTPFDEQAHAPRSEDDRLAALLEREASRSDVDRALEQAAKEGRTIVVNVITTWRGLERMNHEPPSNREVADRLGVSHPTVGRALAAFGKLLAPTHEFQAAQPRRKRPGQQSTTADAEPVSSEQDILIPTRRYP
jgi:RNA polymerase sigma factor (sigma-70 family)